MQVVILCGGQGTRAYPYTQSIPKALMEINGIPIVEQVMRIYAKHGHTDFLLSCGYLKENIFEYFQQNRYGWNVQCVDTGADADTGDRIYRLRDKLEGRFMATYCDGLSDIDLDSVEQFHGAHGGIATLAGAAVRSQYGLVYSDDAQKVTGFEEKPILPDMWLNGGFFIFEQGVFEHWNGHNLERDVLPALTERGDLFMYKHRGFWRSMDTYKDQQELNQLWESYSSGLEKTLVGAGRTPGTQA